MTSSKDACTQMQALSKRAKKIAAEAGDLSTPQMMTLLQLAYLHAVIESFWRDHPEEKRETTSIGDLISIAIRCLRISKETATNVALVYAICEKIEEINAAHS